MSTRPTTAEMFVEELRREGETTHRFLSRIPEDKLDWRAHEKSHAVGTLAFHIASLPDGITAMAMLPVMPLDDAGDFFTKPESKQQILTALEKGLVVAEERLSKLSDDDYEQTWTATLGGKAIMSMTRRDVIRTILFSHTAHHRGQLGVYLRLLGQPVPSSYGPSADEMPPFLADAMKSMQ
jgi:uncharacterized damage-inducible protein DinB